MQLISVFDYHSRQKDEESLANAVGMNRFTSAIVLSQMTLDKFIAMSPYDRHRAFSAFIGAYAIVSWVTEPDVI